ncbi:DUF3313 domain-containing protein [Dasania sp. GY-MA-18]|uniref:DUF3313 domain-containing protein n=1 Tax=Dasania phycosphaerae TaxID=2950436 RepID=A0A9J6RHN9_9GAMM|nr:MULTISPECIES: DUF3313 domain-containing protein [Dasania]MCR8921356.1 DUF3313 domain-containing protein [Dasania sp. GY-MA-18]MCZ0863784.1 DUF3313 domain-containing protein [Dasania phycosphaerae]MCZ0867512.1 DUF3313 domain-containing protein [Dasania phycosphaerae]
MKTLCLALISALLLSGCMTHSTAPQQSDDGLQLVSPSNFDTLYLRPGTDFSRYSTLQFETMPLSYSDERRPHKLPNLSDKDFQFSDKEMGYFQERARKGFSAGFDKTNDAQGQLIVRSSISELYLTAPIKNSIIQPDKSFVQESSRMVITTELVDANSQQVLLRATDKLKTGDIGTNSNNLSRMNSVTYWQDVYREFRSWGSRLKSASQ